MTRQTVHVEGLNEALGREFSLTNYFEQHEAELTDEHAASSYGLPVLVHQGQAYGPADLPGVTISLVNGSALIEPAQAAGWTVKTHDA